MKHPQDLFGFLPSIKTNPSAVVLAAMVLTCAPHAFAMDRNLGEGEKSRFALRKPASTEEDWFATGASFARGISEDEVEEQFTRVPEGFVSQLSTLSFYLAEYDFDSVDSQKEALARSSDQVEDSRLKAAMRATVTFVSIARPSGSMSEDEVADVLKATLRVSEEKLREMMGLIEGNQSDLFLRGGLFARTLIDFFEAYLMATPEQLKTLLEFQITYHTDRDCSTCLFAPGLDEGFELDLTLKLLRYSPDEIRNIGNMISENLDKLQEYNWAFVRDRENGARALDEALVSFSGALGNPEEN